MRSEPAEGMFYAGSPVLLLAVCLIWGFTIVADSVQFLASITELAESTYVGTALPLQTCMGFLLTLISIRVVPVFVDWISWNWVFALLVVGPLFGIVSMARLKRLPDAAKIGGERRAGELGLSSP